MSNENIQSSELPLFHIIISGSGQIDRSQISINKIPVLTVVYDGSIFSVIEGEEHLKKVQGKRKKI